MKRQLLALLLCIVSLGAFGCSKPKDVQGKYVLEGNSKTYLELKPIDATHGTVSDSGLQEGVYQIKDGDRIYLNKGGDWIGLGTVGDSEILLSSYHLQQGNFRFVRQSANPPSGTTSNSGKLTTANAQAALEKWIRTKNGGTVEVIGIQELPQENAAKADIKFTKLDYARGEEIYTGPGSAIFTHYSDGRWVLSRVQTSQAWNSRTWDSLSIEAR